MAPVAPKRASACGSATSGSDLSSDSVGSSLVSLSSLASHSLGQDLQLSETIAEHNWSRVDAAQASVTMATSCSSVRDSAQATLRTESSSWRSVSSSLAEEYLASLGDWQLASTTTATSPSSAAGSVASTLVLGPTVLRPVMARPLRRSTLGPCDPAGVAVPAPAGAQRGSWAPPRRSYPCPAASMPIPVPHSRSTTVKAAKPKPFLDLAPPCEGRDASGRRDPSQNKMLKAVQAYYDKERRARAMRPAQQPQPPLRRVVGFEL